MKTIKYCFQSDGTKERGAKIIKALEKLGGRKSQGSFDWDGRNPNYYYFLSFEGIFNCNLDIPKGYVLANPDDILNENIYPKEMYISDESEKIALESKVKRIIVAEVSYQEKHCFVAVGSDGSRLIAWKYAVDIPKEEMIEPTLNDVAAKLNAVIDKLNIPIDKLIIKE